MLLENRDTQAYLNRRLDSFAAGNTARNRPRNGQLRETSVPPQSTTLYVAPLDTSASTENAMTTLLEEDSHVASSQWLIDTYLTEQKQPTALDLFTQNVVDTDAPLQSRYYRDLIPSALPGTDEQYAFEVDLDACSGCKACVTACHNLNGLEDDELWRNVGMLHGGSAELPVLQHVTTACHHCIEPACLEGCPVNAYEKDPVTGIVKHLDDQCIGCQYCMLKCPYDVPRYSKSKGIVRKCDMCQDRLAADEAPACVQACPTQAIRIRIVHKQTVIEETEGNRFLPGAPDPDYTIPTTVYKTNRSHPRNLLPADYYSARPQHGHLPLVFMLVLTQMSVGAFLVEQALFRISPWLEGTARIVHLAAALSLGLLGLGAAVLHLGRPLYAFRAFLGLKKSWLSREIVAFGLFAAAATAYAGTACLKYAGMPLNPEIESSLGAMAAATGVFGVVCSVMIYVDTRRPFWNGPLTAAKFFLTMLVLGIPMGLLISMIAVPFSETNTVAQIMAEYGTWLLRCLLAVVAAKLTLETMIFASLRHKQHTPLKRTALLLTGDLGIVTLQRYFFGFVGGIVLPLLVLNESSIAPDHGYHPLFISIATVIIIAMLTVGELLERYLFFRAVAAQKMPGAPVA